MPHSTINTSKASIAVVIPTYQRPRYLKEAIESIWEQTVLPFEIIIGDDSIDNNSELLIQELSILSPVTIRYFHNKPSLKQTNNIQMLFEQSKSEYIVLLHDDDILLPRSLELLLEPFQRNNDIIASFGNQILVDEHLKELSNPLSINDSFFRIPESAGIVDGFMAGAVSMFPNDGFMVRRKEALLVGYFHDGRAGKTGDFYFGFRLGKLHKPFYYVNEITAKYRISPDACSIGSESCYWTVKILFEECLPTDFSVELEQSLKDRIPIAITIAINKKDRKNAIKWLFSKYYRYKLISPRGIKRILLLIWSYCNTPFLK